MQEQVRLPELWVPEFFAHFPNNTNSWLAENNPPPPPLGSELLMEEKLARSWDFEF